MVYPRQYVPRMEEEWIAFVDPWKSYASPAISTFMGINPFSDFVAGVGKSILSYVASFLFL
jgi:hypothetical protein